MRVTFVVLFLMMVLSGVPLLPAEPAKPTTEQTVAKAEEPKVEKKEPTPEQPQEKPAEKPAEKPKEVTTDAQTTPEPKEAEPEENEEAEAAPAAHEKKSANASQGPSAIVSGPIPTPAAKSTEEKKPELPVSPKLAPVPEEKPKKVSATEEEPQAESEAINIDTLNLEEPRGNWLLKRKWWEESERLYEKIQAISVRIDDIKMAFHQQRSTLDREVFPRFYQQIGIGEGQLNQLLTILGSEIIDKQILADKEKEDALERPLVNRLKAEKENLERLQKMVKSVETYDVAMQEALIKLRDQVKIARRYEMEAWDTFKSIARELSDRKAYEQYYAVKGYETSIKDIEKYLKGPFGDYFNMLDGKIKQEIAQVQKLMADLQKRGVDLKNDSQKLEQMLEKQKEAEKSGPVEEQEEPEESSILSYITWPFVAAWDGIKSVFSSVASLFSNTSKPEEEEASGAESNEQ